MVAIKIPRMKSTWKVVDTFLEVAMARSR